MTTMDYEIINAYFKKYLETAHTTNFMVGGDCGGVIKFAVVDKKLVKEALGYESSSDENEGKVVRIRFTKELKKYVKANGIELATTDDFEKLAETFCKDGKKNRGRALEKLIFDYYGIEWNGLDHDDYRTSADITVNGIGYQIKAHHGRILTDREYNER